ETRGIAGDGLRQIRLREYLLAEEIRERDFGGRNEIAVIAAQGVHVLSELRQLTGSGHALAIHDDGYPLLLVAVLARMDIERDIGYLEQYRRQLRLGFRQLRVQARDLFAKCAGLLL